MYQKEMSHEQTDYRFRCAVQNEQGYLEGLERAEHSQQSYGPITGFSGRPRSELKFGNFYNFSRP